MNPLLSAPGGGNRLLAALPAEDFRRLSSLLTDKPMTVRHSLQRHGEPLQHIYFPTDGLYSLVMTMADGATAEIAMVGAEGLIGVEAMLGSSTKTSCDVLVQMAGGSIPAMNIDAFLQELDRKGAFHSIVTKYAQAFMGLVTQSVACNGLHSAEARCCRWLLHAQDRLSTNDLALTHELLSTMLGVRRPTVSLIMEKLAHAGAVSSHRGMIRILDRRTLELRSCECHKAVKAMFDHLLPPGDMRPSRRTEDQTETALKAS